MFVAPGQLSLFAAPDQPEPARFTAPAAPAYVPQLGMLPTDEQSAIRDAFSTGQRLVIEAGAGTGKTSTLRMLATDAHGRRRGLYVAYSKPVADEARNKFPTSMVTSTAHSLAYRAIGWQYAHRLPARDRRTQQNGAKRLPAREVAKALRLRPVDLDGRCLDVVQLAKIADQTVTNYCHSADYRISVRHIPADTLTSHEHAEMASMILPAAERLWADLCDPSGMLWFEHDHYLKMWQLTGPTLPYDYILFDEAQDADPVIASIVAAQDHAQLVYVGDRSQAIYAWRGAVDAMAEFEGVRLQLTQSFRFGPAVAAEANEWLAMLGASLRITGTEQVRSELGSVNAPDAILCRTNGAAMGEVMDALNAGRKVWMTGGGRDIRSFAYAARSLMQGKGCDLAELAAFKTWRELVSYVEDERAGKELKSHVAMVHRYGPAALIDAVNALTKPHRGAEVTVSTAHGAKGLEWRDVRIGADFTPPLDGDRPDPAELRLAYVSVTRPRRRLDCGSLVWRQSGHIDDNGHWRAWADGWQNEQREDW